MASGGDTAASANSGISVVANLETCVSISLKWIIKDFDRLYEACDAVGEHAFAHLKFATGAECGFRVKGKFFFSKRDGLDGDGVYLSLKVFSPFSTVERTKIDMSYHASTTKGYLISTTNRKWIGGWEGYLYSGTMSSLQRKHMKRGVLALNLNVHLERVSEDIKVYTKELRDNCEILDENVDSQGFGELLLSGQFSDVTFVFSNEEDQDIEIRAHKVLLSARSAVFASMFNTNMKEGITGKVMIDDISAETFKVMLGFIYNGKLNVGWGSAPDELIYSANKYQLQELKEILEENILDAITVKNAINVRKMARLCNLQKAENTIEKYVKDHVVEFMNMMEI